MTQAPLGAGRGRLSMEDAANGRKVWCHEASPVYSIYYTELGPGGRVPLHRQVGQVAVLQVVRGERILTVGSKRSLLHAGEVEVVPAYGYTGIEDPQEGIDDGPCAFWTTYILVEPPLDLPGAPVRRIVAVRREEGRISQVRLDDGRVLTLDDALREVEAGRIRDLCVVRPEGGGPCLAPHPELGSAYSLDEMPLF